jgi:hypothetical protein
VIQKAMILGASAVVFGDLGAEAEGATKQKSRGKACVFVANSRDVVGVLFASALEKHQNFFEKLRRKHDYFLALRARSTNRFQLPYALDVINYFFEDRDLSFAASIPGPQGAGSDRNSRTTDLTEIEQQQRQVHGLIELGLELRPDMSQRQMYLDILSPGWRDPMRTFLLQNVSGLSYVPKDLRAKFPPQRLPYKIQRTRKHGGAQIRIAPNDTRELASFLTGCTVALQTTPVPDVKRRERQALADKLQIHGTDLEPLRVNKKFRIVRRA